MIQLNKQEKAYYKKMLSNTSKLGVKSISLNAKNCKTGSKLAKKKGSVCHGCYALKGCYQFPVVQNAMARRMEFFNHKDFIKIMVWLLQSQTKKFFRWFDSGDVQSVIMALNILEVCKLTPDIKHWIPSKEYKIWRDVLKIEKLPSNVCLRMSSPNIDQEPLKGFNNTSTVHENKKAFGLECKAYRTLKNGNMLSLKEFTNLDHNNPLIKQLGNCGNCKACYDTTVKNISYPKH